MYKTIEQVIGNTPLVKLQKINPNFSNNLLLKLEGNNPASSVKDRAAFNMIDQALKNGKITAATTLIEATSGNTGIALAMMAAIKGLKIKLIMPEDLSQERKDAMLAYGAELILVSSEEGMEGARDLALKMQRENKGVVLDQFADINNSSIHYKTTAKELWEDTNGEITHFISSMGTTGTITGVSKYLKEKNNNIKIIGLQPDKNSKIPGIRCWSKDYVPEIYDDTFVDKITYVSQKNAEYYTRLLARQEGILAGCSTGAAVSYIVDLSKQVNNAVIVAIACDRGDRYLSTGVFSQE